MASAATDCDERDLDTVLFKREFVALSGKPDNYVDKRVKAAVIACFEELPRDRRSTDAVHAVTLEWPNTGYEGSASGSGPRLGGGGADYPPKVENETFTACVTKAIPKEYVSSIHPHASKIQAIKLSVLAYTRGAVNRYLTGGVGTGAGAGAGAGAEGFGRATRPCQRPDRDE